MFVNNIQASFKEICCNYLKASEESSFVGPEPYLLWEILIKAHKDKNTKIAEDHSKTLEGTYASKEPWSLNFILIHDKSTLNWGPLPELT